MRRRWSSLTHSSMYRTPACVLTSAEMEEETKPGSPRAATIRLCRATVTDRERPIGTRHLSAMRTVEEPIAGSPGEEPPNRRAATPAASRPQQCVCQTPCAAERLAEALI